MLLFTPFLTLVIFFGVAMFEFLGFGKKKGLDIDFDPELVFYALADSQIVSIRVSSGDELNINKNLRQPMGGASEVTLGLNLSDTYESEKNPTNGDPQYITGEAYLRIKHIGDEQENQHILTNHRIAVYPEKIKKGKKVTCEFPPIEEVKQEIEAIWQDEFAAALDDYMLAGSESDDIPKRNRKTANKEGMSLTSKICIVLIALAVIIFGYGKFNKKNQVQNNGDQTIMSMYDEINKMPSGDTTQPPQPETVQKSADQEAMEEFGLEEGIKLD